MLPLPLATSVQAMRTGEFEEKVGGGGGGGGTFGRYQPRIIESRYKSKLHHPPIAPMDPSRPPPSCIYLYYC